MKYADLKQGDEVFIRADGLSGKATVQNAEKSFFKGDIKNTHDYNGVKSYDVFITSGDVYGLYNVPATHIFREIPEAAMKG